VLAGAVLFVALLVVLVATRALRRRQRDEIRSVHHYHDRLDTLHVEPHDRGGSVRVVAEPAVTAPPELPGRPRVQFDASMLGVEPVPTTIEPPRRHGRTWALNRMQPRARVDTATLLIVTIVLAALVALAIAGYLLRTDQGSTTTTTLSPGAHAELSGDTVVRSPQGVASGERQSELATSAPTRSNTNA
jgi:hypothetical protein